MEKNKYLQYLGNSVAAVLIIFTSLYILLACYSGFEQVGKPFAGFFTYQDQQYVFVNLLPYWNGVKAGIKFPDQILEVDGVKILDGRALNRLVQEKPVGIKLQYKIKDVFSEREYEVAIPTQIYTFIDFFLVQGLLFLASFFYFLCGALVFVSMPNRFISWAILAFCFSALYGISGSGFVSEITGPQIYNFLFYNLYYSGSFSGATAFILTFVMLGEPKFFKNKPWRYSIFLILASVVFMVYLFGDFILYAQLQLAYIGISLLFFAYYLVKTRYSSSDPVMRQRARMLIWAGIFSAVPVGIGMIAPVFIPIPPYPFSFLYLFSIFMPIAMTYGVLRHNLFEVDEIVKRTVIYSSFIIFSASIYALILWFSNVFLAGFAFYQNPLFIPVFLIAVLFLLIFLRNPIQAYIDRRFFKTKIDINKVMEQVKNELMVVADKENILESANNLIGDRLNLTNVEILLEDDKTGKYQSFRGDLVVEKGEEIARVAAREKRLISHNELLNDPRFRREKVKCLAQMARIEAMFVMPVIYRGKMPGIVALGERKSAEESFSLQDIDALRLITNQTAVALENARLYQSLKEATKELEKLNVVLEYRVEERSKELTSRNTELEKANKQIATAIRHKSEFLANMSHELRTPLTSIIGFAELIETGIYGEAKGEVKKVVVEVRRNGKSLLELINNILDYSKMEAGKYELSCGEYSFVEMVDAVLEGLKGSAEKKGIKIEREYEEGIPIIYGDAREITRVVENLVKNAIIHSQAKNIRIRIGKGEGITFEVIDDGIGIEAERMEHIFEEFQMPRDPRIERYQGVGLGLAISKKIIELHGGRIEAESRDGKGTRFSFSLPLRVEEKGVAPAEISAKGMKREMKEKREGEGGRGRYIPVVIDEKRRKEGKGKRVLSIEDNPDNRKIIRDFLTSYGYEVIEAVSGRKGLEMILKENPDVVICDIRLPEMDGLELVKKVRQSKNRKVRGVPIIFATSYAMPGDAEKGYAAGGDAYITKPFNFKELLDTIKDLL